MFKKLFNKEEGYILVTSFVVLLVIVILGVVYANLAITQARQAERHNDRKQAYYYARSGSERAYEEMINGFSNGDSTKFQDFYWDLEKDLVYGSDENEKINVDIKVKDSNGITLNLNNSNLMAIGEIRVETTGKVDDIS